MSSAPALVRLIPGPVRHGIKTKLRPYAERFFEAYLHQYADSRGDLFQAARMIPTDAFHLPVRPDPGRFMLPKADPNAPKWSDGFATPPEELWHGYAPKLERVMEIGEINVRQMREILGEVGGEPKCGDRILDFGCAAGFMIRHLHAIAEDNASGGEVWGVDMSGPHIEWCQRHLMPPFRFAISSSFPSLPFPDEYFDLAYCGSVFSHIGESCDAWLLELARIIRPGGRLYLTMVTKQAMWRYINEWPRVGFSNQIQQAFTREELESDFAMAVCGSGPGCHAIYDLDVFKTKCEMAFDVVSVVPDVYTYQWALVLRRHATARSENEPAPTTNVM